MNKSCVLLYEGLYELNELSKEVVRDQPMLYEGVGYSPLQIIAEKVADESSGGDKESFLKRTTAAVKKVQLAAQTGIDETEQLRDALQATQPPMSNSVDALNRAAQDLKKNMPGDSFLSKLGQMGGAVMGSLFGKQDDPVEKVTEVVADVQQSFRRSYGNDV